MSYDIYGQTHAALQTDVSCRFPLKVTVVTVQS
jgi:hypothetical protein